MLVASQRNSGLFSIQLIFVVLGIAIVAAVNILSTLDVWNMPGYIHSVAFTATILCFAIAFLKYRFISSLPITLKQVVNLISGGYLVIDKQSCILERAGEKNDLSLIKARELDNIPKDY